MNTLPIIGAYLLRLLIAVLIFGFFWAASRVLPQIFRRYKQQEWIRRHLPLIEATVWVVYIILFIQALIKPSPYTGIVFVLIIVALSWRFLNDWISGLFIKIDNNFRPGQRISLREYDGTIKELGLLAAEIEVDKGEVLVFPYHKLEKEVILKRTPSEKIQSHAIDLSLSNETSISEWPMIIKHAVLNLPWAVPSRAPFIELLEKEAEYYHYRVVLYAIDPRYFSVMEQQLRERFEDKKNLKIP